MLLQVRAQIIPIPVIRVIFRSNTTELPTKPAQMLTVIAIGVLHKQNIPKMLGENVCQTARLGKVCIFILTDLIQLEHIFHLLYQLSTINLFTT